MKKYEEMDYREKKEVASMFSAWLCSYKREVIVKVLARRDEILNNAVAMSMIKELKERSEQEQKDFESSISFMIDDLDNALFSKFDPHDHVVTHANSYRDVLYDMFIKD